MNIYLRSSKPQNCVHSCKSFLELCFSFDQVGLFCKRLCTFYKVNNGRGTPTLILLGHYSLPKVPVWSASRTDQPSDKFIHPGPTLGTLCIVDFALMAIPGD